MGARGYHVPAFLDAPDLAFERANELRERFEEEAYGLALAYEIDLAVADSECRVDVDNIVAPVVDEFRLQLIETHAETIALLQESVPEPEVSTERT